MPEKENPSKETFSSVPAPKSEDHELLKLLVDSTTDGVWQWDMERNEVVWSDGIYAMLGYSRQTVSKQSFEDIQSLSHPEDRARHAQAVADHVQSGKPYAIDVRLQRADGSYSWFRVRGTALRTETGQPYRMVGTVIDITEKRQKEEAVQKEREQVERILSALQTGLVLINPDLSIAWVNDKIREMFPGEEPVGKQCYAFFHKTSQPCDPCSTRECFDTGRFSQGEKINTSNNRCFLVIAQPVRNTSGNVVNVIEAISDITEKKRTEEALRKRERQIEKQLIELDILYATSPVGLAFVDRELRYVRINETLAAINGKPVHVHIGRTVREIIPDLAPRLEPLYHRVIASGEPILNLEFKFMRRKDRYWLLNVHPVVVEDGTVMGVNTVMQDITNQKNAEEALRVSREQLRSLTAHLQDALEQERIAISREIHDDLGQAISALKLDIAWLGKRIGEDRPEAFKKLEAMRSLIDQSSQSVKDLCSRLRPGILDDLGLIAALEWQTEDFQARSGIPCTLVAAVKELPQNDSTALAVYRICQEALTNVSRHAGASAVTIRITREGGTMLLEIIDNGIGITAEDLKNSRSFGIMGMRERAYGVGGTFHIEPGDEAGTRVAVRFPVRSVRESMFE